MIPKATSARYMPSLGERFSREKERLTTEKRSRQASEAVEAAKPFTPHPPSQKQKAFLALDAQEALFGGAAGGGKSDALIMDSLAYVKVPTYSALLMRRKEVDLYKKGAILDRAQEWFAGTAAVWDAKLKGFRFPSYDSNPGATISFGFLNNDADKDRWRGPEFQYIGIDELTEWSEAHYAFLFSRLRSLVLPGRQRIPTRMRAGTNPGGAGHDWVFSRFVQHARQSGTGLLYDEWRKGEKAGLPYFESPPSPQVLEMAQLFNVRPQGAYFVPAFAEDNPALDQVQYKMNLARLDPLEFAWFAKGDWTAVPSGRYFHREWFQNWLEKEPPGVYWIRYWDLAGTEPKSRQDDEEKAGGPAWTAGVKLGVKLDPQGNATIIISDVVRNRLEPPDVESFVKSTAEMDGKRVQVLLEQEPGSAGKATAIGYQRRVLFGWRVHADKVTGPKEEYWKAFGGFCKAGGVALVRGAWNDAFIKELISLPNGKKDQADAASRGYAWLIGDDGKRLYRIHALANVS
jgi:phage terminase large subunit-like protein